MGWQENKFKMVTVYMKLAVMEPRTILVLGGKKLLLKMSMCDKGFQKMLIYPGNFRFK